jgi:single-strand DNA-binding protein
VNAWRGMARNVAGSLVKGDAVTVFGRLNVSTWSAQDGAERTTLEIEAISVGHDLRFGTTRLARNEKVQREEVAPAGAQPSPTAESFGPDEEPPADPTADWQADPSAA